MFTSKTKLGKIEPPMFIYIRFINFWWSCGRLFHPLDVIHTTVNVIVSNATTISNLIWCGWSNHKSTLSHLTFDTNVTVFPYSNVTSWGQLDLYIQPVLTKIISAHSHAPNTPTIPSISNCEIVGVFVEK